MNGIDERTLKIVELARNGAGGERSNAQRILRAICAQQGLSYDDLMAGSQEEYGEQLQRAVLAGSQMDRVRLHKAIAAGGGQ